MQISLGVRAPAAIIAKNIQCGFFCFHTIFAVQRKYMPCNLDFMMRLSDCPYM
jgi:hypothetical protein